MQVKSVLVSKVISNQIMGNRMTVPPTFVQITVRHGIKFHPSSFHFTIFQVLTFHDQKAQSLTLKLFLLRKRKRISLPVIKMKYEMLFSFNSYSCGVLKMKIIHPDPFSNMPAEHDDVTMISS